MAEEWDDAMELEIASNEPGWWGLTSKQEAKLVNAAKWYYVSKKVLLYKCRFPSFDKLTPVTVSLELLCNIASVPFLRDECCQILKDSLDLWILHYEAHFINNDPESPTFDIAYMLTHRGVESVRKMTTE